MIVSRVDASAVSDPSTAVSRNVAVLPAQVGGVPIRNCSVPEGPLTSDTDVGSGSPASVNFKAELTGAFPPSVTASVAVPPAFTEYCAAPNPSVSARDTVSVAGTVIDVPPPAAANCTVAAPAAAAEPIFTAIVAVVCPLASVTGAAVTPAGNPCGVTTTGPVNPACRTITRLTDPLVPGFTGAACPVAVSENWGPASTFRLSGVEAVTLPAVSVAVSV